MGSAHSSEPRSVSLDNPTPAGVIDVSDEVVQRLKKGITKQVKESAVAAKKDTAPPPPPPKKETPRVVPVKPAPIPAPRAPSVVYPPVPPTTVYVPAVGGATMTAMEMRRQKEIELQENDAQWRKRMAQLEQTLNKTNAVMESEYLKAVEDVRKRFATASPTHQLPPCQDLKAQVIACYRAHPGETLKCAEEVATFRNCVSVNRIQKLDAEEVSKSKPVAKAG